MKIEVALGRPMPQAGAVLARAADVANLNALCHAHAHRVTQRVRTGEHDHAVARARPQQRLARLSAELLIAEADLLTVAARHARAPLPLLRVQLGADQRGVGIPRPDHRALIVFGRDPRPRDLRFRCPVGTELLDVREGDRFRLASHPAEGKTAAPSSLRRSDRGDAGRTAPSAHQDERGTGRGRRTDARVAFEPLENGPCRRRRSPPPRGHRGGAARHRQGHGDHGARRSRSDRGPGGGRARPALRHPDRRDVHGRQCLPRSRPERPPGDGGGVHRHRTRPQRRAVRRRGQLFARGPGGAGSPDRADPEERSARHGSGDEGSDGRQGRTPDGADLDARPLPRVRPEREHLRHQPAAPR